MSVIGKILNLFLGLALGFLPVQAPPPLPSPSPQLPLKSITYNQTVYLYSQYPINDQARLQLFSNLDEQRQSVELKNNSGCRALFNAGFYDTGNQHLGWFQVDGRELSARQDNRLFDSFFSLNGSRAEISFAPQAGARFGLQSGPMLVFDGKPLTLLIKDDQPRRRVVAALTQDNQLLFLVILSDQSNYAGPRLTDTPKIVQAINPQIVSAINLDGGSASAFLTPEVSLPEYQPIGGYFCYTGL